MQKQVLESGTSQLALRVYDTPMPASASVVIGDAMGVRQDCYAPFAEGLSSQGFRVTTFDCRGSGESVPGTPDGSLRGFKADLFDWRATTKRSSIRPRRAVLNASHRPSWTSGASGISASSASSSARVCGRARPDLRAHAPGPLRRWASPARLPDTTGDGILQP